jgi:hypothetical protein
MLLPVFRRDGSSTTQNGIYSAAEKSDHALQFCYSCEHYRSLPSKLANSASETSELIVRWTLNDIGVGFIF